MAEYGRIQKKQESRAITDNRIGVRHIEDIRKAQIIQCKLIELVALQQNSNNLSSVAQWRSTSCRKSDGRLTQLFKVFPPTKTIIDNVIPKIKKILNCTDSQARIVFKEFNNYWTSTQPEGGSLKNKDFSDDAEFATLVKKMVDYLDKSVTDTEGIRLTQELNKHSGEDLIFLGYHGGRLDIERVSTADMPNQLGDCLYITPDKDEAKHYAEGASFKTEYEEVAYVYKVFIKRDKLIERLKSLNKPKAIVKGVSVKDWWAQWPNVEEQYKQRYDIFVSALYSDTMKKYTIQYAVHDTSILEWEEIETVRKGS